MKRQGPCRVSLMLIAFHKPYSVISQFTPDDSGLRTLAEFGFPPRVYPIGRLDADSEGLLLLSDETELNHRLLHPRRGHRRVYWAQVERIPLPAALQSGSRGERRCPVAPGYLTRSRPFRHAIRPSAIAKLFRTVGWLLNWWRAGIARCAGWPPPSAIRRCGFYACKSAISG